MSLAIFGFEFQTFPHGHDGDAMHGDLPADDDLVADLGARWLDVYAFRHEADAGGVDENLIGFAAVHDFSVPGDERDARLGGGTVHRLHDAPEIRHRQAFFEDEADGKMMWARAAHREVVNRAVNGQFPDVSAGKEDGADDIRVRAESDA